MRDMRKDIDAMVDEFGYDYVIGYCLCSEYDLRNRARREIEDDKAAHLFRIADRYQRNADRLSRERVSNGL